MIKRHKMTHRIMLLHPVEDYDSIHGREGDFEETISVWAEFLRPGFATRDVYGDATAVEVSQGIRVRPCTIAKGWRVKDIASERIYEVGHIDDSIKGELILTTMEIQL